jgi:hypothetical protein
LDPAAPLAGTGAELAARAELLRTRYLGEAAL